MGCRVRGEATGVGLRLLQGSWTSVGRSGAKHPVSECIGKEEEAGLGGTFNVSDQREGSQIMSSVQTGQLAEEGCRLLICKN